MKAKSDNDLFERIDRGVKRGVAQALEAHRRAGEKVAIWQKGRVVEVLPGKESHVEHGSNGLRKLARALDQIERRYPSGGRRFSTIVENPCEAGYMPFPKPSKKAVAKGRRLRKAMSGLSFPARYYFEKKAGFKAKVVGRKK